MTELSRSRYAALFGPTTGDRIRLADTDLFVEITEDRSGGPGLAGDEAVFGGGKVLRESMGQSRATRADGAPDTVITGAVILDYWGIIKADIGIRDGRIVAIGKAGNPDIMSGVHPDLVVGPSTEVIAGNGRIVTAGAIDCHVHLICPQIMEEALGGGITTIIAGGTGPAEGSKATTVTPGSWHLARMLEALDSWPLNVALLGKGNTVSAEAMWEQLRGGAAGFKLHEDWGTTPAAIDACLTVCEAAGVQANIHTDTLNEAGFVEDTLAAIKGRSIHAYHTEGAGGGHAPDIITVAAHAERAAELDQPDPAAHRQHARRAPRHADGVPSPQPQRPRGSRLRREPDPAVHDRRGGPAARHRRDLDDRQRRPGDGPHRRGGAAHLADRARDEAASWRAARVTAAADNNRVRRYVAKYTICPAVAHGLDHEIGSVEVGKLADLVLWEPAFFGVRPHAVVKGGMIAWAAMGDANASIPTPQPVLPRPMFGAAPAAAAATSVHFVAPQAIEDGLADRLAVSRRLVAGRRTCAGRQGADAAQRRTAAHRGRPRHVHGAHRRRRLAGATRHRTADGAAILPVLMSSLDAPCWPWPTPGCRPAATCTPAVSRRRSTSGLVVDLATLRAYLRRRIRTARTRHGVAGGRGAHRRAAPSTERRRETDARTPAPAGAARRRGRRDGDCCGWPAGCGRSGDWDALGAKPHLAVAAGSGRPAQRSEPRAHRAVGRVHHDDRVGDRRAATAGARSR